MVVLVHSSCNPGSVKAVPLGPVTAPGFPAVGVFQSCSSASVRPRYRRRYQATTPFEAGQEGASPLKPGRVSGPAPARQPLRAGRPASILNSPRRGQTPTPKGGTHQGRGKPPPPSATGEKAAAGLCEYTPPGPQPKTITLPGSQCPGADHQSTPSPACASRDRPRQFPVESNERSKPLKPPAFAHIRGH
ncbi:hypothetical protein EAI_14408 [Harpegnathos saltator]|uniref:Uncharacterized protein n=1 Tax=Harpegnathos saltator TaxID=610380 RepID=E2BRM1_HARSA|nr:hypothetical protein EAI_14408 [Harpegnathos saltator]